MIITKIEISEHKIALKHPFVTALRRVESVEFVRVEIYTDTGLKGTGEAPPTKAITGEDKSSIIKAIKENITPKILHVSPQEALKRVLTCKASQNSANAAVDIALHDILSQKSTISNYYKTKTDSLKTAITISLNTPEMMQKHTLEALRNSFDILKIKVGSDINQDIRRIKAVCEVAADATIMIDANQAWSLEESLEILKEISHLNIELIEQPLKASQLQEMAQLVSKSHIPILADESAFNLTQVKKVIELKAADMINIKLMKCGGITAATQIIRYCQSQGIYCMMGSMLEGPASIKAAVALAMAYPQSVRYIDLDSPLLYRDTQMAKPLKFYHNEISL